MKKFYKISANKNLTFIYSVAQWLLLKHDLRKVFCEIIPDKVKTFILFQTKNNNIVRCASVKSGVFLHPPAKDVIGLLMWSVTELPFWM